MFSRCGFCDHLYDAETEYMAHVNGNCTEPQLYDGPDFFGEPSIARMSTILRSLESVQDFDDVGRALLFDTQAQLRMLYGIAFQCERSQ